MESDGEYSYEPDLEERLRSLLMAIYSRQEDEWAETWLASPADGLSSLYIANTKRIINGEEPFSLSENSETCCRCACCTCNTADLIPWGCSNNPAGIPSRALYLTPQCCFREYLENSSKCSVKMCFVYGIEVSMLISELLIMGILSLPFVCICFLDNGNGDPSKACIVNWRCCCKKEIAFTSPPMHCLASLCKVLENLLLSPFYCITALGLGVINGPLYTARLAHNAKLYTTLQARSMCNKHHKVIQNALEAMPQDSQAYKELSKKTVLSWNTKTEAIRVYTMPQNYALLEIADDLPRLELHCDAILVANSASPNRIPDLLTAKRNLSLIGKSNAEEPCMVSLPNELSVAGNAVIAGVQVLSFGKRMKIDGDLILRVKMSEPYALPDDLEIAGELNCAGDEWLTSLPARMATIGALVLTRCERFENFPESLLLVNGDVLLMGCSQLKRLPDNLVIMGDLFMHDCVMLQELPENLVVKGTLSVQGCTSLNYVPSSLRCSGQEMNFSGCISLMQLPLEPFEAPRATQVVVNIQETSIVGDALDALRNLQNDNIQIFLGAAYTSDGGMISLNTLYEVAREFHVQATDLEEHIDKAYVWGVLRFLSMLLSSKEFQNEDYRDGLKERVKEVLELVINDPVSREEIIIRMLDATDACADKPIWALGQMQIVVEIAHARGNREKLRKLGMGIMRLNIVHEHVEKYINSLNRDIDDVCVYLGFEIALRQRLNLPVSSKSMIFANYIKIDHKDIAHAEKEALAISEESFKQWLAAWPEWQRQDRLESVRSYLDLLPADKSLQDIDEDPEGHLSLLGEPITDPILVLPDDSDVWSYNDFCAQWVRTGCDFANCNVSIEDYPKLVRRLQNTKPTTAETPRRASLARSRLSSRSATRSSGQRRGSLRSSQRMSSRLSSGHSSVGNDQDNVPTAMMRYVTQFISNMTSNHEGVTATTSAQISAPTQQEPFSR